MYHMVLTSSHAGSSLKWKDKTRVAPLQEVLKVCSLNVKMVEYCTTSLRLCIFTLLSMQLHSMTNVLLNASCNSELPRRQLEDLASFQLEVGGSVQELTDEDCRPSSRIAGNASLRQGNDTDARSSLASTWLKDIDAIIGPVAMMFNVTDAALRGLEAQHDFCGEYCNGTQKISKSSRCFKWPHCRRCYCDDSCGMYGDCCPQQGSKTSRAAVRTKDSFTKCVSVCHGRRRHLVSAVCSCPPHAPSTARRDCRGSGSSDASTPPHPVLSANLSVLYCSADCAWCHGESDVVELTAGCREEHDEDYVNSWADDSQHDTILMAWQVPRNYSPRACYDVHFTKEPQQVISCNATWFPEETAKNIADLCANYTSPVLADGVIFENLFCALCNDIRPKCLPVTTLRSVSGTSILVNLMGSTTVGPKSCKSEEWYDVAKNTCRQVHCEPRRVLTNEHLCKSKHDTTFGIYKLALAFKPLTNATRMYISLHWHKVRGQLVHVIAELLLKLRPLSYAIYIHERTADDESSVVFLACKSENRTKLELEIIGIFLNEKILLRTDNVSLEFQTYFQDEMFAGAENVSSSFDNGTCCKYERGDTWLWNVSNRFSHRRQEHLDVVTPLAYVLLAHDEYEMVDDMVHLTYTNTSIDARYVRKFYFHLKVPIIHLQAAYSASNHKTKHIQAPEPSLVNEIISTCCLSVSIVSLVFMLLTYGKFSQLRTLPGLNNICLAAWLLVGQLMVLIVPDKTGLPAICVALGMLLHYAWLCVVCWTSVCSFHMFYVFVLLQASLQAQHRQSWYLRRYAAVAHLLPAMVVISVVGVSQVISQGQNYGYGGHVCYLNSVILVGVGFVLPLAACVTFNLVLLGITARTLSNVERVPKHSATAEKSNLPIYAKLSSLTGTCWILALLAEIPGWGWLKYPSAVLNGLQGFHLALSYAVNKRALMLWRQAIQTKKTTSELSKTQNTSGTTV